MMGNYLYMPRDYSNYFKIYDTDTYIPLNDFVFPSSINGTDYRLDGIGILNRTTHSNVQTPTSPPVIGQNTVNIDAASRI